MTIKNAKILPRLYYGLHMVPGVAEYQETNGAFRILIEEKAIKNMDQTFQGKPVYVGHVDEVKLEEIKEADGYVVRSFFNKSDGKHWVEFLVTTDKGHEAIRGGWKLSNAYVPNAYAGGGLWHGVEYSKEVKDGEYEHLAIVQNPRYEESIILTPEQFKQYNNEKEIELLKVKNSKGDNSMFKFFKKEKIENSVELESTVVELPKSKKQLTIAEVITKLDDKYTNAYHCNGDELVKVGEKEMSVKDIVNKILAMEEKEAADKKENEDKAKDADKSKDVKENEDKIKEDDKKKENEDDKKELENEEDKKKKEEEELKKKNSFNTLKNAHLNFKKEEEMGELSFDQVARGVSRYGSGK